MDISADLMELGRTPVAVVCAGVKSILDIEKTLEVLVMLSFIIIGELHCLSNALGNSRCIRAHYG